MRVLHRRHLEDYLKRTFGPRAKLLSYGLIGQESSHGSLKGYGYGAPVKVTFNVNGDRRRAVIETMSPGPFGHEHMADRAQGILWDYESYGRLPKHVAALDVGAFTAEGDMLSVAPAKEFFVLNQWVEGEGYNRDFDRLMRTGRLLTQDRRRTQALADYLAEIHRVKRRDPNLYRRRLRELIGHGECIMGLTDNYPARLGFITPDLLRSIEDACNRWRWRLRGRTSRLSQVHGDFHPWNVLFRKGTDFSVLDRSRGEWGEPADDVTSMSINYLFHSLRKWGELRGPFEMLFRQFWDRYMQKSGDKAVVATAAPFFAFRGLVIANPVWYPNLSLSIRRKIFNFVQNVLAEDRFNPAEVNRYCRE